MRLCYTYAMNEIELSRREMLGAAFAAACSGLLPAVAGEKAVTVGETLADWRPGELKIHFIHTGVGECQFFVFPDGTTLMLDCGDHAALTRLENAVPVVPSPARMAGEWAARYVLRVNPNKNRVDYLEASHWHSDHTGSALWQTNARGWNAGVKGCFRSGFGLAAEFLRFGKAIDRGYPNYDDPIPVADGELTSLGHMKRLYAALKARDGLVVEKFRLGATDQIVPLKRPVAGFSVFNLCANGKVAMPDGSVRNVYGDLFENGGKPGWLNENGMSLGHVFRYGKFAYYTAGDFSDPRKQRDGSYRPIEVAMAEAVGHVNVAKMNHHGHHSMPDALVKALSPQVWTACVWDQLHTVPETLGRVCNPANYPAGKLPLVIPSVFPEPRATREANADYFRCIEPACCGRGCHVVVTVPSAEATSYRVDCVGASDETMTVVASRTFEI